MYTYFFSIYNFNNYNYIYIKYLFEINIYSFDYTMLRLINHYFLRNNNIFNL